MHRWAAVPLLIFLPLIWRAGRALVRLATNDEGLARILAPGVALSLWLLAIHVLGLLTHSYGAGLFGGTLLAAGIGFWIPRYEPWPPDKAQPLNPWMFAGALAAVAMLLGPEIQCASHDETWLWAHIPTALQIQNGIYPPRNLIFPQFEFKYHYAIDLGAAVVSSLLAQVDVLVAIHLLALLLWGYLFCLCWTIGERFIGGRAAGPVTGFSVLFAGGFAFFCEPLKPLNQYLESDCTPAGVWITPPLVSNFLQHPWSLGFMLLASVLLLFPGRATANRWWWVLLSLLVAFLSFSESVMFICLLPSLVVFGAQGGALPEGWRPRPALLLRFVPWGLAMLLAARLLHGFFASVSEPPGGGIEFHPIWRDASLRNSMLWNLESMGLLLPLGLMGAAWFRRESRLLLLLAGGGLIARNLITYRHYTFDIVKFSMVSQVALALLAAAALTQAFSRPRWRIVGVLGLAVSTAFGLAWPVAMSVRAKGYDGDQLNSHCFRRHAPPPAPDLAAIGFLRGRLRAGESVYRTENAESYTLFGGLPQLYPQGGPFGFSDSLFATRQRLIDHPPGDPGPFVDQGFRWLVLAPRDAALERSMQRWVKAGRADLVVEFPPLKIFHLD